MKKLKVVARFKGFDNIDVLSKEFDNESEAKECASHWKRMGYVIEITKREVIKDEPTNNV